LALSAGGARPGDARPGGDAGPSGVTEANHT